jgi:hypothetical protein
MNPNPMATERKILDMSPLGMRYRVIKNAEDTNGMFLELEWELLPHCNMIDPLIHAHPHASETVEVLEGTMDFFVKDQWISLQKGEKLTIPKGVAHSFRNPTHEVVKVYNIQQPAMRMEAYFDEVVNVLDTITHNRTKGFSMNLKAKLYLGTVLDQFRPDIVSVNPPDFVMRIIGLIGKLRG